MSRRLALGAALALVVGAVAAALAWNDTSAPAAGTTSNGKIAFVDSPGFARSPELASAYGGPLRSVRDRSGRLQSAGGGWMSPLLLHGGPCVVAGWHAAGFCPRSGRAWAATRPVSLRGGGGRRGRATAAQVPIHDPRVV